MTSFKFSFPSFIIAFSFLLIGCSTNTDSSKTKALFDTKAEAEMAAKNFNCVGAHRMGEKWMPCTTHEVHKQENYETFDGHSHKH